MGSASVAGGPLARLATALAAATDLDGALIALAHHAVPGHPASSSTVIVHDGQVATVLGYQGPAQELADQFAVMPLTTDLPITHAILLGQPVWLPDRATRDGAYPLMTGRNSGSSASLSIPLRRGFEVVGALGLTWADPTPSGPPGDGELRDLASVAAATIDRLRLQTATAAGAPLIHEALAVLEVFFRHAPAGIAFVGRDQRVITVNEALAAAVGAAPADLVGADIARALPFLADQAAAPVAAVLSGADPVLGQDVHGGLGPDDAGPRTGVASYFPLRSGAGQVVGVGILVIETTETLRKEAALRAAEAQLETLLRGAPVGLALIGADLRLIRVNEALGELNGLDADRHVGHTIEELGIEVDHPVNATVRQVLQTGQPVADVEIAGLNSVGEHVDTLVSFYPVTADDGVRAVGLCVVDMTERNRSEHVRRAALEQRLEHHEIAVALLQRAILPAELPRPRGVELAARYQPAASDVGVGGDWYDAFVGPDGRTHLVIGDLAGHGIAAAEATSVLRNAARAYLLDGYDPTSTVGALDRVLAHGVEEPFATVAVCTWDPAARTLTHARAGHLWPVLVADGEVRDLEEGGPPLGVGIDRAHEGGVVHVTGGATLVLCTDGLVERRGENLSVGLDRLRVCLEDAPVDGGVEDLCEDLIQRCLGSTDRFDDTCVLIARFAPPG